MYDTPSLPPFHYFTIGRQGRLFHGRNPLTAIDIENLVKDCGITHILDLRESKEWAAPGRFGGQAIAEIEARGIVRQNVPVTDTTAPQDGDFTQAVAFLEAAMALLNSRLYVHCRYGRERTGAILMAWRALRDGTDGDSALASLNAEGAHLTPLPHQKQAAKHWLVSQRL